MIKITAEEAQIFKSKLEYRFKKSGNPLVEKLDSKGDIELTEDETVLLSKKLEYKFKNSGNSILEKLKV